MKRFTCRHMMVNNILRSSLLLLVLICFVLSGQAAIRLVTSLSDNGSGTLREQIGIAMPGDTIIFSSSIDYSNPNIRLNNPLVIGKSLVIIGPGKNILNLDAPASGRVITIDVPTIDVFISGFTFLGEIGTGLSSGSSIDHVVSNAGRLELEDCDMADHGSSATVRDPNSGIQVNSPILNTGTMHMRGCELRGNFERLANGGGGVTNQGRMLVEECQFLINDSGVSGGAIRNAGYCLILDTRFAKNVSAKGGAIRNEMGDTLIIKRSVLEDNESTGFAGAISNVGYLELDSTSVLNNIALFGGGIENFGTATVRNSRFADNIAFSTTGYGGVWQEFNSATIYNSTFDHNRAQYRGGVFDVEGGFLRLYNCTLYDNQAGEEGGAIYYEYGSLVMNHCTVVKSRGGYGGGLYVGSINQSVDSFVVRSSLFWGNESRTNQGNNIGALDRFFSAGGNFISDTSFSKGHWLPSDVTGNAQNPLTLQLQELRDNGGFTPTVGLLKDSLGFNPAINTAISDPIITEDQRGLRYLGPPDIGAFEYQRSEIQRDSVVLCIEDPDFRQLDTLRIVDPNGGGLGTGENVTLIFGLPPGFEFNKGVGNVHADSTTGIRIRDVLIGATTLTIAYDRTFFPGPSEMVITGLEVRTNSTPGTFDLFRIGGNAILIENQPKDSVSHATFSVLGSVEELSFDWSRICEGQATAFTDQTRLNAGIPGYWKWEFDDPGSGSANISVDSMPFHRFTGPGAFDVKLITGSTLECADTVNRTVFILDSIRVEPDMPYDQSFDQDAQWVAEGNLSSWEWGAPAGNVITPKASNDRVWTTSLTGPYNDNEQSWVNSPCFDVEKLKRPFISLDIASFSEEGFDGAVLQVSRDGGIQWENVGGIIEGDTTGLGWFNREGIVGNPGQQLASQQGWSGKLGWVNARHRLDTLVSQNQGPVRFRIAFGSNASQPSGSALEGFAFDNVFIGERKRQVLFEHFVNLNAEMDAGLVIDSIQQYNARDLISLQYHTGFPVADNIHTANRNDPDARALWYGISSPGHSSLDGNVQIALRDSISQNDLNLRTLVDPQVNIEIDTVEGLIRVLPEITLFNDLIVHAVIVEDGVPDPSQPGRFLQQVVRKLLPDAGGAYFPGPHPAGFVRGFRPIWSSDDFPPPSIIGNMDSLRVIAFVQDADSKEILQALSASAGAIFVSGRKAKPGDNLQASTLRLFPNPARDHVQVELDFIPEAPIQWQIADLRGKMLMQGREKGQRNMFDVQTSGLASGRYTLVVQTEKRPPLHWPLIILR